MIRCGHCGLEHERGKCRAGVESRRRTYVMSQPAIDGVRPGTNDRFLHISTSAAIGTLYHYFGRFELDF